MMNDVCTTYIKLDGRDLEIAFYFTDGQELVLHPG